MKYADKVASELRVSAVSLLISLQSLLDIQSSNVQIAESLSLSSEIVDRHRRFAEILEQSWKSSIDVLGVSMEEYEAELRSVNEYEIGLSDKDEEKFDENTFRFVERKDG